MAVLKIRKQDGSWAVVGEPSAIKFTEQNLTEDQKKVARENIGAKADIEEFIEIEVSNLDDFVFSYSTMSWNRDPLKSYKVKLQGNPELRPDLETNSYGHFCKVCDGDIIRGELLNAEGFRNYYIKQTLYSGIPGEEHYRYYDSEGGSWTKWTKTLDHPVDVIASGTTSTPWNDNTIDKVMVFSEQTYSGVYSGVGSAVVNPDDLVTYYGDKHYASYDKATTLTDAQKAQARENIDAVSIYSLEQYQKREQFNFIINGFFMNNWHCEEIANIDILAMKTLVIPANGASTPDFYTDTFNWYLYKDESGIPFILGNNNGTVIDISNMLNIYLPGVTFKGVISDLEGKTKEDLQSALYILDSYTTHEKDIGQIGRPGRTIASEEFNNLNNIASGISSHAEGDGNTASGYAAHAEGQNNTASGNGAHTEGYGNISSGYASHTEGRDNNAVGDGAHAEGIDNDADGAGAHAEGRGTDALGDGAHTEGYHTVASGEDSHAEGSETKAYGYNSHAEGTETEAHGVTSHTEGVRTKGIGMASHSEGYRNISYGNATHTEGLGTIGYTDADHSEGYRTKAGFLSSISQYIYDQDLSTRVRNAAHAEGYITEALYRASHAEGENTRAVKNSSHVEGLNTLAYGVASHAEGKGGNYDYSTGYDGENVFLNIYGWDLESISDKISFKPTSWSYTEQATGIEGITGTAYEYTGNINISNGQYIICFPYSFNGAYQYMRIAKVEYVSNTSSKKTFRTDNHLLDLEEINFAFENGTEEFSAYVLDDLSVLHYGAIGDYSHTEGLGTIAFGDAQHVQGKYNTKDLINKYAHIVGNGTSTGNRSNAHTVDWNGNGWFKGSLRIGGTSQDDTNSKLVATEDFVTTKLSTVPFVSYGEQTLTNTQKAQARTNIGAISDADISNRIPYNAAIQNTNPFGGKKLYINSMDDGFYALDKRAYVTGTIHSITDDAGVQYPHTKEGGSIEDADYWVDGPVVSTLTTTQIANLFNGYYDEDSAGAIISSGQYVKIHIQNNNAENWTPATGSQLGVFSSYPYGYFYLSYYYAATPNSTKRSQYRCYNKTTTGGDKGWFSCDAELIHTEKNGNSDINWIEKITDIRHSHRSCVEFIVFGNDSHKTNLIEIELQLQRPNIRSTSPLITNFGTNTLYYDTYWKSGTTNTVTITPSSGTVKATTFDGKLKNSLTINGETYNGSAAKTININATSVTVGGTHQSTFNADTKMSILSNFPDYGVIPQVSKNGTTTEFLYRDATLGKGPAGVGVSRCVPTYKANNSALSASNYSNRVLVSGTPTQDLHCANKGYVDTNFVAKSAESQVITGDISITGNLTIQGQTYTQSNETLRIADNIIELNSNKQNNSTALSGIAINKDANSTYGIMYNPSTNTVDLGEGKTENGVFQFNENEGAPLAIRDNSDNIADGAIMIFDKKKNRLVDSGFTIDSMKQWVREYIESYMSTEEIIEENGDGTQTLIINIDPNKVTETDDGILNIGG